MQIVESIEKCPLSKLIFEKWEMTCSGKSDQVK